MGLLPHLQMLQTIRFYFHFPLSLRGCSEASEVAAAKTPKTSSDVPFQGSGFDRSVSEGPRRRQQVGGVAPGPQTGSEQRRASL